MSLGTGALKVSGKGSEEYKHCREASMAPRQAGTTQTAPLTGTITLKLQCILVEILTKPNTFLLSQVALWEGRAGLMNPQRIASKDTDPQQSLECKAVCDLPL